MWNDENGLFCLKVLTFKQFYGTTLMQGKGINLQSLRIMYMIGRKSYLGELLPISGEL